MKNCHDFDDVMTVAIYDAVSSNQHFAYLGIEQLGNDTTHMWSSGKKIDRARDTLHDESRILH